jgi:hypothetical protein
MATIASLLRERVTLQVRSVDRIFVAGYVPKLQPEGQVVRFLLDRGFPIPSPAALGKIGSGYVRAIERFASKHKIPMVRFRKGESKELVARRYMQKAERERRFGVVMIGVAQEKASAWRGFARGGSASHPHVCYRRMSVFPNHYYVYVRDPEWGPAFIKTCAYAPYGVCGSISTPTSGPSARPPSARSAFGRSITAFARSMTPTRSPSLRQLFAPRHRALLAALGVASALAVHGRRPPARIPLRTLHAPARAV